MQLRICKKCDKPKKKQVEGTPKKGKKLIERLEHRSDLPFEIVPCKCLGKCKKWPNAVLMPPKEKLHRLTEERVEELAFEWSKN